VRTHRLRPSHHVAYLAVRSLLAAGRIVPLTLLRRTGGALGALVPMVGGRDVRRAREHLAVAFPDLAEDDRARLLRASLRHLGRVLGEVAWLRHATAARVDSVCDITGTEHFAEALERGTGAILATGHLGNWEMMNARLFTAGLPMTIIVRSVYDPRLDRLITAIRSRFGTEVIHRQPGVGRTLMHALSQNRVIGLLIDQDIPDLVGAFVPFFGRPAWTPTGGATLALRAGCPVVPTFTHRRADGRHLVEIQPPLADPVGGSAADRAIELTAAATAAIEAQIRRHPEQWVWMHRRWRTQPEGE
jgi:KDO2-lipid IV(A) lauroyltransferase